MASRDEIITWCDERLRAPAFQDVAVNGLQVAGRPEIRRIAVSVSTSQHTLTEAAAWEADALLVHHGLLWDSRQTPITGLYAERLRLLFRHDLNLIAYHLPLDAHPEIGNNIRLLAALQYAVAGRFGNVGSEPLGYIGRGTIAESLSELSAKLAALTGRLPLVLGRTEHAHGLRRIAVLSGSGSSALDEAAALGCDVLVTGDVRETTMAEARELGMAVIAAGHEATERLGVQALAADLEATFGVETRFIPDPNPI